MGDTNHRAAKLAKALVLEAMLKAVQRGAEAAGQTAFNFDAPAAKPSAAKPVRNEPEEPPAHHQVTALDAKKRTLFVTTGRRANKDGHEIGPITAMRYAGKDHPSSNQSGLYHFDDGAGKTHAAWARHEVADVAKRVGIRVTPKGKTNG